VEIREAEDREAALVAGLALEGLRHNTPLPGVSPFPVDAEGAESVRLALRRGDRFFLARAAGTPIGVVRWGERREFRELAAERSYAEVSGLAVLPEWRRQGVGGDLLAEAERDAARHGHEHALLRTTLELGLVPWYERLGYEVRATRQLTYADAPTFLDVVMTRRLVAARRSVVAARPVRASPFARGAAILSALPGPAATL
jgi:GNAT superfamily N-acetyltransferase